MSARAKTGPRRLVPRINVGCCFGFVMMVSFTYATVDGCRCRRSHFTPDSWRGSSKRGLLLQSGVITSNRRLGLQRVACARSALHTQKTLFHAPFVTSRQAALRFLLAALAYAVDLEGVARRQVLVLAANFLLNALNLAREELHRAAALGADHVMVIAAIVLVFVTSDAVIEGDFAGQPALGQQLQRAIDGGKSDALVVFLDKPTQSEHRR